MLPQVKYVYSYKGSNKASNPDYNKNSSSVTPEETLAQYSQVIMTIRNLGRKVELDTFRDSTYSDTNIISQHRNELLLGEGRNEVSKPDIGTAIDRQTCKYINPTM